MLKVFRMIFLMDILRSLPSESWRCVRFSCPPKKPTWTHVIWICCSITGGETSSRAWFSGKACHLIYVDVMNWQEKSEFSTLATLNQVFVVFCFGTKKLHVFSMFVRIFHILKSIWHFFKVSFMRSKCTKINDSLGILFQPILMPNLAKQKPPWAVAPLRRHHLHHGEVGLGREAVTGRETQGVCPVGSLDQRFRISGLYPQGIPHVSKVGYN